MSLFKTKLTTALGAAFAVALTLGTAAPAEAAPPEGMRWGDLHAPYAPRRQSQPTRVGPVVSYPRFYSYPPVTMMPAVMTPTPATVSVRGPDGVVRAYPSSPPVGPVVAYSCR